MNWRITLPGIGLALACAFVVSTHCEEARSDGTKLSARGRTDQVRPSAEAPLSTTLRVEGEDGEAVTILLPHGLASGTQGDYEIPWMSINAGGMPIGSANYGLDASVGQSISGEAVSNSYGTGIGYWYGVSTAGASCSCPYQSDFDEDGFLTGLDLSEMIDILFAGSPDVQDPDCPSPRADFDCDLFSTALDLAGLIDHLFAGQPGPCDPCAP